MKCWEGRDSSLPSPRQVPRASGGGSGRVTRPWRGRLLPCCLPAGESRRRGWEPPARSLAPSQPLLGKQESQAQLIKLWAEDVPNCGIQYPQKPWLLALLRLQCRPLCERILSRVWGRGEGEGGDLPPLNLLVQCSSSLQLSLLYPSPLNLLLLLLLPPPHQKYGKHLEARKIQRRAAWG